MKRIFIAIMACAITAYLFLAVWDSAAYCQCGGADESAIDESESDMGQELDAEISGDEAQSEAEIGEMEESMDTGGRTN